MLEVGRVALYGLEGYDNYYSYSYYLFWVQATWVCLENQGTLIVRNINTINQENPTSESVDSERKQLRIWLSGAQISSAIKLRKLHCLLSQALEQSPFETAVRPSWVSTADKARLGRACSVDADGNRRAFLQRTNLFWELHPGFLLGTSVEPLSLIFSQIYSLLTTPFI